MGALHVIGEPLRVRGFIMAGAVVYPAEQPDEMLSAWRRLPADAVVVVLTPAAAIVLGDVVHEPNAPLSVVIPCDSRKK